MHFYPSSGGRYRTLLNVLSIWYLFTVSFCEGIDAFVRNSTLPSDPLSNLNNQSFNSSVLILFEFLELIFLQGHFVTSSALLVCVSFCRMCTFWLASIAVMSSTDWTSEVSVAPLQSKSTYDGQLLEVLPSYDLWCPISFSFCFSIIHSGSSSLQKTCYQSRTKVLIQKGKEFEYLGQHFTEQHEIHELLK